MRLLHGEQSGQTSVLLACLLITLLGFTGLVVDIGRALYVYRQLQAATDAAAMAGGYELPASDTTTVATQYSAVSGSLNARGNMAGVTMVSGYPKILCLTTLKNQGMACAAPANGNAVQVRQQMTLPTVFMKLLGKTSLTLSAVATASMTGSVRAPYNVAIIVDTTLSMNTTDSDASCNATRISCALAGVQVLLQNLSPCAATLATCGAATNGNVSAPVDEVALYTFPGLASPAQALKEYDCSSSTPTGAYYTASGVTYKVVDFSSDYRTSNGTTTLNSSSNLVKAVGGVSGCTGMTASIGYGTYYAEAMYIAGTDLYYQQQSRPGSQNVVVILGDGDNNAPHSYMPNGNSYGTYPSYKNECAQAISLAQQGYTTYGMRVYSVAYGSASSGCSTDSGISPCATMTQMASQPQYFYSDYTASGASGTCISSYHSTTSLNSIFQQIAGDLSVSRLIPDNTT